MRKREEDQGREEGSLYKGGRSKREANEAKGKKIRYERKVNRR